MERPALLDPLSPRTPPRKRFMTPDALFRYTSIGDLPAEAVERSEP